MDLVGRWWNGQWGRLGRRDVWLRRRVVWEVEARQGEADDGKSQRWEFTDDEAALTMVNSLMTSSPGEWKHFTGVSASSSPAKPQYRPRRIRREIRSPLDHQWSLPQVTGLPPAHLRPSGGGGAGSNPAGGTSRICSP